jgi:hypothetical protein
VLLRLPARRVFLEVQVEGLGDAVLGLDVVAAVGLRPVAELEVLGLAHARHVAQALQLVLQAVLPGDAADEDPVLLAVVVRLVLDEVARRRDLHVIHLSHEFLLDSVFVQLEPLRFERAADLAVQSRLREPDAALRKPSAARSPCRPRPTAMVFTPQLRST